MNQTAEQPTPLPPPSRDHLLAALRCGRARVALLRYELDELGVLLSQDAITVNDALANIEQLGAFDIVFMRGRE